MQAWFAENQTYAGATLAPGAAVVLVRADATSYCLQSNTGTIVEHENGPGGTAQPGPCVVPAVLRFALLLALIALASAVIALHEHPLP